MPSPAPAIALVLAAALSGLPGCGEDGGAGADAADEGATTAPADEGVITEPPPETAPAGAAAEPVREEQGEARGGKDEGSTATVSEVCPDVEVTPNSGGGLFDVEAEQITCTDAATILQAWGEAGFPGEGPEGFACEQIGENTDGSTRLRCSQGTAGGVLEFTTGS